MRVFGATVAGLSAIMLASCGHAGPPVAASAMLPARLLHCTIGRMINADPKRPQTAAEIRYDGQHRFDVFLPTIAVRTTAPPDATDPPEPVDPATRIVADPDGLARDVPPRIDRVVDQWPDRVELATTIAGDLTNVIIIDPIDPAAGTATLFMTRAQDVSSYDFDHLYRGQCAIELRAKP